MKHLTFSNISIAVKNLKIKANDSYIDNYREFILYFKNIEEITTHHLVIASHFVYGWMPTIIELDKSNMKDVLTYLNAAKSGQSLFENELTAVKNCINNSMVGASKLLHFINPEAYAIWDSRVYRYVTGKTTLYGIDKPRAYLQYLEIIRKISRQPDYHLLHNAIQRNFDYEITPMRAIEFVMFETNRRK